MIKTHWVKRAVAFGAAVTLAVTCMPVNSNDTVSNASAAVLCLETEMAGLSLSLDKY